MTVRRFPDGSGYGRDLVPSRYLAWQSGSAKSLLGVREDFAADEAAFDEVPDPGDRDVAKVGEGREVGQPARHQVTELPEIADLCRVGADEAHPRTEGLGDGRERGVGRIRVAGLDPIVDLRGHGESEKPRDERAYAMEHLVADVLAVPARSSKARIAMRSVWLTRALPPRRCHARALRSWPTQTTSAPSVPAQRRSRLSSPFLRRTAPLQALDWLGRSRSISAGGGI